VENARRCPAVTMEVVRLAATAMDLNGSVRMHIALGPTTVVRLHQLGVVMDRSCVTALMA
jgi:microcystin degradation protein MlrC